MGGNVGVCVCVCGQVGEERQGQESQAELGQDEAGAHVEAVAVAEAVGGTGAARAHGKERGGGWHQARWRDKGGSTGQGSRQRSDKMEEEG